MKTFGHFWPPKGKTKIQTYRPSSYILFIIIIAIQATITQVQLYNLLDFFKFPKSFSTQFPECLSKAQVQQYHFPD